MGTVLLPRIRTILWSGMVKLAKNLFSCATGQRKDLQFRTFISPRNPILKSDLPGLFYCLLSLCFDRLSGGKAINHWLIRLDLYQESFHLFLHFRHFLYYCYRVRFLMFDAHETLWNHYLLVVMRRLRHSAANEETLAQQTDSVPQSRIGRFWHWDGWSVS